MKLDTIDIPGDRRSPSTWVFRSLAFATITAVITSAIWAVIIVATAR